MPDNSSIRRFLVRSNSKEQVEFSLLYEDVDFGRQMCLDCDETRGIIVTGGMEGHLLILSSRREFKSVKWRPHSTKVNDVFLRNGGDSVHLFSFAGEKEELFWYRISFREDKQPHVEHIAAFKLPGRIVMDVVYSARENVILLGTRKGAIAVYDATIDESSVTTLPHMSSHVLEPTVTRQHAHGREAVTSIVIDEKAGAAGETVFFTTGRDGNFCRFAVRRVDGETAADGGVVGPKKAEKAGDSDGGVIVEDGWRLETLVVTKITKGWLEKAKLVGDTVLLCGFYNKRFFVYNETKRFEMFNASCGGAHRRWDFYPGDGALRAFAFGFVRNSELRLIARGDSHEQGFKDPKLKDSFHGVETRVVRFLGTNHNGSTVFVTSGEDGILKFHECRTSSNEHKVIADVRKHVSVVRGISLSAGANSTLLFTAGAREELRCWSLDNDMSAGTGFRCLELACAPMVSLIKETRIMDASAVPVPNRDGLHLVGTACSDAFVRIWTFNEKNRQFALIGISKFHGRCVLKCQAVVVPGGEGQQDAIVVSSAGTDGRIAIWECNSVLDSPKCVDMGEPIIAERLHQSGVNGLDVRIAKARTLLVASGGDDNAVAAMTVSLAVNGNGSWSAVRKATGTVVSAHSSPVSAVRWIRDDIMLSTSLDQRLNAWAVSNGEQSGELSLACKKSYFSDIADISDLDVYDADANTIQVAVVGFGMEVWETVQVA
ncbi:WD repeat-containing protein 6 [Rhizophlyctis rosea]|uniref:WD repeat-containing protein 6 n=1 Tax=Rhizophlyctis rosea TaxID=64517 RepID=A0AAD5X8U4_9FUNG|nr:WD repeat-containing protein 6 [Rhizophlyctis rosea]